MGVSADARSLRLDLTRVGGQPAVLARGAHSPSAIARVPAAAAGGIYVVSNRHAGRTASALVAVRGAQRARVALLLGARPTAADEAYQRRLDALGIRFDAFTRHDFTAGALAGYKVVVAPPEGGGIAEIGGVRLVTSLAGITAGLGS